MSLSIYQTRFVAVDPSDTVYTRDTVACTVAL